MDVERDHILAVLESSSWRIRCRRGGREARHEAHDARDADGEAWAQTADGQLVIAKLPGLPRLPTWGHVNGRDPSTLLNFGNFGNVGNFGNEGALRNSVGVIDLGQRADPARCGVTERACCQGICNSSAIKGLERRLLRTTHGPAERHAQRNIRARRGNLVEGLQFQVPGTQLENGCIGCNAWLGPDTTVHYVEDWATEADIRRRVLSDRFTSLLAVVEAATKADVQFDFVTETAVSNTSSKSANRRPRLGAYGLNQRLRVRRGSPRQTSRQTAPARPLSRPRSSIILRYHQAVPWSTPPVRTGIWRWRLRSAIGCWIATWRRSTR